MTVKQLKGFFDAIPQKESILNQQVKICGDLIEQSTENFELDWMDCSDGFLLFVQSTDGV